LIVIGFFVIEDTLLPSLPKEAITSCSGNQLRDSPGCFEGVGMY
jgi:hypothetical protein